LSVISVLISLGILGLFAFAYVFLFAFLLGTLEFPWAPLMSGVGALFALAAFIALCVATCCTSGWSGDEAQGPQAGYIYAHENVPMDNRGAPQGYDNSGPPPGYDNTKQPPHNYNQHIYPNLK
jgi:hypothetical protein